MSYRNYQLVFIWFLYISFEIFHVCNAHGRMENPPARNAMWRHGFNSPPNYNDLELNCGGVGQQHLKFGGRCGVCGDGFDANPRAHEVGGRYATGRIVRYYSIGQTIDVHIFLSANHIGYMEFRICATNDPNIEATHQCLDENILQIVGHGTRYKVNGNDRDLYFKIKLPSYLKCSHCVMQWKYRAGNNWGSENGKSGLGFGIQEEFYNCADIAIIDFIGPTEKPILETTKVLLTWPPTTPPLITTTTTKIMPITTITTLVTTKTVPVKTTTVSIDYRNKENILCEVTDLWKKYEGMLEFCIRVCSDPDRECPLKFCKCHGINAWLY